MMLFSLAKLLHFFCIYKFDTIFYTIFILLLVLFLHRIKKSLANSSHLFFIVYDASECS